MKAACSGPPLTKDEGRSGEDRATREVNTHKNYSNEAPHGVGGAFSSRRRFLVWACMAGYVGPERVVERILAELEHEDKTP